MVGLDHGAGASKGRAGFDDVRVEGPLGQIVHIPDFLCLAVEDLDKDPPDDLALPFRILDALQGGKKLGPGPDEPDVHAKMPFEQRKDLFRFPLAQQAVVDKDAGQLVSDGLVEKQRRDGRVHSAAQSQDDASVSHCGADLLHGIPDKGGHGPAFPAAADEKEKVFQHLLPFRGVHDFRMELESVKAPLRILNGGNPGIGRFRGDFKSCRQPVDRVPVAHPAAGVLGDARKDSVPLPPDHVQFGKTVLPLGRPDYLAAQAVHHVLQPVADAESGNAQLEDAFVHPWAVGFVNACRPSGENDPLRIERLDRLQGNVRGLDLAVHLQLPDPAGDQLVVLGSEIDNKNHDRCLAAFRKGSAARASSLKTWFQ
ncbi:MAG: hypothetical protein A4E69_02474 [Syntrophus sp. PtaB.Bin138]|nr:MAG: hypothetical protein A4E69_02474 [Syntrophus sp. PtaB.Bin138]